MIDRRILIADDDQSLRLSMAELLGDLGTDILHAETGLEALDWLRRRPIDVALLDMHMPGLTGLEVLCALRRETLLVPCIVFSAEASDAVCDQALREGALAVLRKPFEPSALRREVERVLGRGRPPS
jgi:CheY-like chemotaxis protein